MEAFIAAFLLGTGWLLNKARPLHTATSAAATPKVPIPEQDDVYQSRRTKHVWMHEQNQAQYAIQAHQANQDSRRLEDRQLGERPSHTLYSPLLGRDMPLEHFEHNNMVPYYSGSADARQPSRFSQSKLENFTGVDVNLQEWGKKAAVEIWKPTPQGVVNSSGKVQQDYNRDEQMQSLQVPRNRANERPAALQPQTVGRPGVVGAGWADTRHSVTYKTVDELRPGNNPKITYEGRFGGPPQSRVQEAVSAAGAFPAMLPPKRPHPISSSIMSPTGTSVFKEELRPNDYRDIRGTERQCTDARSAYTGVAGSAGVRGAGAGYGSAKTRVVDPFKQMLGAPSVGPGQGPASSRVNDYSKNSSAWGLYCNNRDQTQGRSYEHTKANIATAAVVKPTNHPVDVARTTLKEATEQNPRLYGIAAGPEKLTMHDPNDVARTTIKETMIHNGPNMTRNFAQGAGPSKQLVYNPEEWAARVTHKQVTTTDSEKRGMEGHVGGAVNALGNYQSDNYTARVTQRQTVQECASTTYGSAAIDGIGGYMTWPGEAKATQKEVLSTIDRYGNAGGQNEGATSRADAHNMTIRPDKEDVIFERAPVQEGTKVAYTQAHMGQTWYRGNADLQEYTRMPAQCGSIASAVPPQALAMEGVIAGRKMTVHHDATEKGAVDQRAWVADGIDAARSQLCSNPYTVPAFDGKR